MKRRTFLKLSSLSLLPLLTNSCDEEEHAFDIEIQSDQKTGHLVFESFLYPEGKTMETETLIVGGGIAGLSAAYELKERDFLLCELSTALGGSSSAQHFKGLSFSQGAHYDLSYPEYYGAEVLEMLKELGIIYHDPHRKCWDFKQKEYLIPEAIESRTFSDGKFRAGVLPEGKLKDDFLKLIQPYLGKMHQPTRLIPEEVRHLDNLTFLDWLNQHLSLNTEFIRALDYHMMDDYGAGAADVSALTGIHYYRCRPYYSQHVELFSPPEGNNFFIQKLAQQVPEKHLKTKHLVRKISKLEGGFKAEVVDIEKKQVHTIKCKGVIYAGHKHALKHIWKDDYPLFENNRYAPWLVMNFVLKPEINSQEVFWQNELLTNNRALMGFVDSASQFTESQEYRVLNTYFCFKPEERKYLANIDDNAQALTKETINIINQYFDQDISSLVEKVFIKVMGHAMSIPYPNYLFRDVNSKRSEEKLIFAGVDSGQLPLFFEAADSGLMAAKLLKSQYSGSMKN